MYLLEISSCSATAPWQEEALVGELRHFGLPLCLSVSLPAGQPLEREGEGEKEEMGDGCNEGCT
jgi:hypothetical protein